MASAVKRIGHGTKMFRSSDGTSSGTFSSVGRLGDVGVGAISREVQETTDMESPNRWREYLSGLRGVAEHTLDVIFDPESDQLKAFFNEIRSDSAGYYKMIFPNSKFFACTAFITLIDPTVPVGEEMRATVNYQPTGEPVWG